MRENLSSFNNGKFLQVGLLTDTLIHSFADVIDFDPKIRYVKLVGFNRGKRSRRISIRINDEQSSALFANVAPLSNGLQVVLQSLPVYNIDSSCRVMIINNNDWTLPAGIENKIAINAEGRIASLITQDFVATPNAQPFLIIVSDARRSTSDLSVEKGSTGIIEVYNDEDNIVRFEVIDPGFKFVQTELVTEVTTGVFISGDIFVDSGL